MSRLVEGLLYWGAMALSDHRQLRGFAVYDFLESVDREARFGKLDAALSLIESSSSRRMVRMRRDIKRLFILPTGGAAGVFLESVYACGIDAGWLRHASGLAVAMTLVHEATHARISGCGIPYQGSSIPRIEALCVREEVSFAERFADSAAEVAEAHAAVALGWWGRGESDARRVRQLRELRMPGWLIRLASRR